MFRLADEEAQLNANQDSAGRSASPGPHPIGGEETQDGLSIIDANGTEWFWMFRTMTPNLPVQTFEAQDVNGPKGPVLHADKAVTVFYIAAVLGPGGAPELWGSTRLGWRFRMSDLRQSA